MIGGIIRNYRPPAPQPWHSGGMSPLDGTCGEWGRKGVSLSDETARKEFGLTQEEIYRAIEAGELHYVRTTLWGNPYLK
jgi:hypothetical protein